LDWLVSALISCSRSVWLHSKRRHMTAEGRASSRQRRKWAALVPLVAPEGDDARRFVALHHGAVIAVQDGSRALDKIGVQVLAAICLTHDQRKTSGASASIGSRPKRRSACAEALRTAA
jgi:hypothetical protein